MNNDFYESVIKPGMTATDADALMKQYASNPKMDFVKAAQYVKEHGGDPKTACFDLFKERGFDPGIIPPIFGKK